jgi:predicted O-methyltransferase YrrM
MTASRHFDHWTPRYIADRLRLFWTERRNPAWPWLTADAVRILDSLLQPTDVGMEFGSGRSTVWLARRCQHLVSVESDSAWFRRVSAMLEAEKIKNVELHHRDEPLYAEVPSRVADESLDFALVDGIARDTCVRGVIPKLKKGGLLVIDNINWYVPNNSRAPTSLRDGYATPVWREAFEHDLAGWRRIWTTNGVTDTLILLKR